MVEPFFASSHAPVQDTKTSGEVKYDNTHETFFVYSYQQILDMINEAIEEVCAEGGIESAPYFTYDSRTQLISVQYSSDFDQSSIEEAPILSFSRSLEEFVERVSGAKELAKNGSITDWNQTLIRLHLSI